MTRRFLAAALLLCSAWFASASSFHAHEAPSLSVLLSATAPDGPDRSPQHDCLACRSSHQAAEPLVVPAVVAEAPSSGSSAPDDSARPPLDVSDSPAAPRAPPGAPLIRL